MASKPLMILGNLISIILVITGIFQVLSWTIAGATILAILSVTTLAPARRPGSGVETGLSSKKTIRPQIEPKQAREKIQERQTTRPHQAPGRPEQRQPGKDEQQQSSLSTRTDFQKSMAPKITPPKTVPTSFSPARTGPTKLGGQKHEAIRPIPVGQTTTTAGMVKPTQAKVDPNSRIISKGDYATYDVELNQRAEVTCEVTASAPVNVYLMDEDNLNSLDLGEEFWSETGEEGVQKATLHFVAPENGKWVLVVENTDNREVIATATVRKSPPKQAPPS